MKVNETRPADDESGVAAIYQDQSVAANYLEERLRFSWQRLLHREQVSAINKVVATRQPTRVLELAPGPARLSSCVVGVRDGIMVENSWEMIPIALRRLCDCGLDHVWKIVHGSAFELDGLIDASSFDLCFTFRFIRHFHPEDRERLYASIRHALTSRGLLMLDVVDGLTREKIHAKSANEATSGLSIYDATYTETDFESEMERYGFKVISMQPVVRNFALQSWISYKCDDVVGWLAETTVSLLETVPSVHPLEWIALCQKA